MNSECIKPDKLIEEYGEWLKREASAKDLGDWKEITLPMLDGSNDGLIFYAKTDGHGIMFTDDGYALESFHQNGVTHTDARRERMERIAHKYGAGIRNGQIVLESEGSCADAMNRYAQALLGVGSMMEAVQHRVAEYFADDVAAVLDECNVFYTASVGIRGVSKYEHNFDFIFQRSANHPTRFCQAPNKFDKNAVRDIMWGWEDTRKAKERAGARLVVIGDDREGPLQDGALDAFTNCGVSVIPYSKLAERAPRELAA